MKILYIVTTFALAVSTLHAQDINVEPSARARDESIYVEDIRPNSDDWYQRSWIHSHISISPPPSEIDFIGHQIDSASVDAVQFHTGKLDLWDAMRKARLDEKLNFKMVATINAAGTWRPQYENDPAYVKRIHPDGSFAGRWDRKHLCFNTPVVRERVIPDNYRKLPARLKPDQVWIDECIITVNLCWCEHCVRLYRERYKSEPPTKLTEYNYAEWTQWTTFHRESFERWARDVRKAVDTSDPGTLVTFNHAWFVEQPENPPAYVRNLSADIHNDHLELAIYARYGGSGPIPFDLMPGLGDDIWAGASPKKLEKIFNDVALIIAHGGRWNIGEYPTDFTSLRKEPKYRGDGRRPADIYIGLARKGAEFARLRQPFCQHTKPVPHVLLLHSASTHYDHVIQNVNGLTAADNLGKTSDGTFRRNDADGINSRVYWPGNNPIDGSLVGAYQALLENHVHFNFTIEDRLANDLKEAALLVLPEQHRLSPASVAAIKTYVRNGGRLLATGSTRRAGLDELFDFDSESPKRVGKGQSIYLPNNFFRLYAGRSGYSHGTKGDSDALRDRAARIFETLVPEDPYTFDSPPWFEWTLRRNAKETELLVHLINREINWSLPSDLSAAPLRCSVLLDSAPKAVSLEPGGEDLKWSFDGSRLVITLDPNSVRNHRIIRINTTPSHPTTKLSPASLQAQNSVVVAPVGQDGDPLAGYNVVRAAPEPFDTIASERECIDYRDIGTGSIIPDEDWGEQPLIVKLADGRWFCVLTTGNGKEGSSSQHIVYTISYDKGKTWTDLRDIEPADGPEASSACPFIVPSGPAKERIYVFYVYNANNIREIKNIDGSPRSRVDLLGEHAFRYTDDYGETWSRRQYLPYRKTSVDLNNSSQGKIQMFWPNDKPMLDKGQLFFAFSKIGGYGGRYLWTRTEGWMWRCDNILKETDVSRLKWTMLPDGDEGLKAPDGIINEEPMSTVLSDGSLYCVARTVQGHPTEYYSRDRGHTWTKPAYMKYASDGRNIAHPRGNSPVWKLSNGKYLYWFHNHTGNPEKTFSDRNPAWVTGGVEVDGPDGKILKWSEPEILLYTDPQLRHVGMTYPDIIEDGGDVYISETQESIARIHKVERDLLEGLWGQFDTIQAFTEEGLITSYSIEELSSPSVKLQAIDNFKEGGSTIDFELRIPELQDIQLLTTAEDGHGWTVSVNSKGVLTFEMRDGETTFSWNSDAGIIKACKSHHVTLVMDSKPGIFFAVVDGIFMDSTHDHKRQFGWGWYKDINTINGDQKLKGELKYLKAFRHYNRALRTSEAIANYKAGLDLRETSIDRNNLLNGKQKIFWSVDKPGGPMSEEHNTVVLN